MSAVGERLKERRVGSNPGSQTRILAASLAFAVACSDSTGPDSGARVTITGGPAQVVQGDVVTYTAEVRDGSGAVIGSAGLEWAVEPSSAALIDADGRLVGYEPGGARVIAQSGQAHTELSITIVERGLAAASFSVIGQGTVNARFTSDLWLFDDFAYTGTWGQRGPNPGNRLYAWDISNPAVPVITDSIAADAFTVNDVKIRDDGGLAVLTHEGSTDGRNGISLLDTSDPLHPQVITRFTDEMEGGVHNVWIEGDFVYAVLDGSDPTRGLRVIDVSDPANPALVSSFYGGAAGNFGQFLHDVYVRDGLAFLSHWNAGLIILDVGAGIAGGSPGAPVEVSRIRPQGDQAHNAWYWPSTGYVFLGEEDFSTPGIMHVIDARDPANPREVATYRVPGDTPHNFWLDEASAILYLGWYTQGLRALDVSGELLGELERQGREITSFLYDGAGACSSGIGTCTWAPQVHDGLVWVSDMNSGLWALRLDR
jgi:hypothetical protein